jgi:DNA-binding NarL/FixJ family response regulator
LDEAERLASGGAAPRFVLVEPAAGRIAHRLAAAGWQPVAHATEVGRLATETVAGVDALVVVCSERLLLTPTFQAETERAAGAVPRVAVALAPGPEAAAYAARLGWHGFVPASSATAAITRTIVAAARGELAFPQSALTGLVRALARVAPVGPTRESASLTPRQQQIVTLIAQGATDAEIATLLNISRSTAHKHVQNARRRLRAKTRGQLVAASRDQAEAASERLSTLPALRVG